MDDLSRISNDLAQIDGQITDVFRALSNGFQKLEKIKEFSRQSRQLEDLTEKMRDCKRLIKEFDKEVKVLEDRLDRGTNKMLNDKKQSMIKELNSYVALKKKYATNIENKRIELFEGPSDGQVEENVLLASSMTNEQLINKGHQMMDETDQAIDRGKKIVQETLNIGTEAAATLKSQTEQMSRVVNELDSIHFSMKRASKLAKQLGRQIATDKCIMMLLFLIVIGVIAIVIVKLINPNNQDIRDIPGLGPPALTRRLLWDHIVNEHF
ncbi:novel plant SNARE 11-like isoform X1 [Arachis ipaensis]|uniref:novel plant SNARE 11-like isoform X1 n=1 Tax=Arachis ipaensis TaxID=130454 RepID=UPI0007AFDC6F|nr:novel plant SNARE 11-like isoform X1 [Arachis ipaensis]